MWPTPTGGMGKQDVGDDGVYARRVEASGFQVMLPAAVKLHPVAAREGDPGDTVNRTQRLKALGNGICVPVAIPFAMAIYQMLREGDGDAQ